MLPSLRRTAPVAVAVAGSLALAGAAQAATTIGSDLATSPTSGSPNHTTTQVAAPGAPNPIAAPAGGVLVRIRLRYGGTDANPGTVGFRILSGANPFTARSATVDGGELRFPLRPNLPAGTDDYVDYRPVDAGGRPIGIAIAAGERLGLAQLTPGPARVSAPAGLTTIVAFAAGQHLSAPRPIRRRTSTSWRCRGSSSPTRTATSAATRRRTSVRRCRTTR